MFSFSSCFMYRCFLLFFVDMKLAAAVAGRCVKTLVTEITTIVLIAPRRYGRVLILPCAFSSVIIEGAQWSCTWTSFRKFMFGSLQLFGSIFSGDYIQNLCVQRQLLRSSIFNLLVSKGKKVRSNQIENKQIHKHKNLETSKAGFFFSVIRGKGSLTVVTYIHWPKSRLKQSFTFCVGICSKGRDGSSL